jgi:hypothetical protein
MLTGAAPDWLVPPQYCWIPPYRATKGAIAADFGCQLGLPPDVEQRAILDAIYAENEPGIPAAFEVAIIAPRQNLKTAVFMIAALADLFVFGDELIVWTAHLFKTAVKAFEGMRRLIARNPELKAECRWPPRTANGDEAIELRSGAKLEFHARSKGGGRGYDGVDKVCLDEGLFLAPGELGALLPTLATRPAAQVRYASSAGLADSDPLRAVRDRGRAGDDPGLAYFEWGAPKTACEQPMCRHAPRTPGCALDRRDLWAMASPAVGRRISMGRIEAFRRALPPLEFGREFLTWWDEPAGAGAMSLEDWARCTDAGSVLSGRPVFAIDVSPRSASAAVVAAGLNQHRMPHAEVVEHLPGTDWVVPWCEERKRHNPHGWVIDAAGPAGALKPDLERAGIELTEMTSRELGQACEDLTSKAAVGGFAHREDDRLTRAIEGAGRRDIGDGLWAWSRKRSDADICPLVAFTEGLWGLSRFRVGEYDLLNSVHVG